MMDKITVEYGFLMKVIKNLERLNPTDETEISFEYLVGSCFPDIMDNIKKTIAAQYTQGYIDGLTDREERNPLEEEVDKKLC